MLKFLSNLSYFRALFWDKDVGARLVGGFPGSRIRMLNQ